MEELKKGDLVRLKNSNVLHIIDEVSISERPKEKAVILYHISGTPKDRNYCSFDLIKVEIVEDSNSEQEITYNDIEQLSDDVQEFIKDKGFELLDSFEFLTKLNELLYESIDKKFD